MFDIGFTELLVIGVVALLVIGPERLPKVARTAGHLFGRFQRYVNSVKSDIGHEMQMEELRKAGEGFKDSVEQAMHGVENRVQEAEYSIREEVVSPVEEAANAVSQPDLFDDAARKDAAEQAEALPAASLDEIKDAPDTKA